MDKVLILITTLSQFCAENQILLFRFPPHTSHVVQPTDRGFFGAFKYNFSEELAKFTVQYPSVSITKQQFPFTFTRAYELSCKMETVKSPFWATGIWPTNRMNVDHNLFKITPKMRLSILMWNLRMM